MKYIILNAILILCAYSMALGETTMKLNDCVRELVKNNPELRASNETVKKARSDFLNKYSTFLPQIYATGGANKSKSESDNGYSDATSYNASLTARQSLFAGFRNLATLNQSRALLRASEMNFLRIKSNLSYSLKTSFANMLFVQEFTKLATAITARRKSNLDLVQLRFEAGREHKGSYLRSRAFLHQAQFEDTEAKRAISVARRWLATTMGWKNDAIITVAGKWDVSVPSKTMHFLDLVKSTPDHLEAMAKWRAARESVRVVKSDFYPEWSASASLGRNGDSLFPDHNQWSIGTTISFPLFEGGSRFYSMRSARAEERASEANLMDSDNQTVSMIEEKFAAWQDAVEQREVQAEFLRAGEVRAEIARSQYSNGLLSFQDWDQIENELINYQKAMLNSHRDAFIAQAAWEKAIGTGVIK